MAQVAEPLHLASTPSTPSIASLPPSISRHVPAIIIIETITYLNGYRRRLVRHADCGDRRLLGQDRPSQSINTASLPHEIVTREKSPQASALENPPTIHSCCAKGKPHTQARSILQLNNLVASTLQRTTVSKRGDRPVRYASHSTFPRVVHGDARSIGPSWANKPYRPSFNLTLAIYTSSMRHEEDTLGGSHLPFFDPHHHPLTIAFLTPGLL